MTFNSKWNHFIVQQANSEAPLFNVQGYTSQKHCFVAIAYQHTSECLPWNSYQWMPTNTSECLPMKQFGIKYLCEVFVTQTYIL